MTAQDRVAAQVAVVAEMRVRHAGEAAGAGDHRHARVQLAVPLDASGPLEARGAVAHVR